MKKTKKQRERIIENVYDIVLATKFAVQARKEMEKDLRGKNITLDKGSGTITIEIGENQCVQYTISIK